MCVVCDFLPVDHELLHHVPHALGLLTSLSEPLFNHFTQGLPSGVDGDVLNLDHVLLHHVPLAPGLLQHLFL